MSHVTVAPEQASDRTVLIQHGHGVIAQLLRCSYALQCFLQTKPGREQNAFRAGIAAKHRAQEFVLTEPSQCQWHPVYAVCSVVALHTGL